MRIAQGIVTTALAVVIAVSAAAPAAAESRPAPGSPAKVGLNGWSVTVSDGKAFGWYIVRNATAKPKRVTVTVTVDGGNIISRTHKVGAFDDLMVMLDGEPVAVAAGRVGITATR